MNYSVIYNPSNDSWADGSYLQQGRYNHSAINLDDGRLMVLGGEGMSERYVVGFSSVEIYR